MPVWCTMAGQNIKGHRINDRGRIPVLAKVRPLAEANIKKLVDNTAQ